MPSAAIVCWLVPALVLLPSGVAKLRPGGGEAATGFLVTLRTPPPLARRLVRAAALLEILVAGALVGSRGLAATIAAAVALSLLVAYTAVILAAGRRTVSCGCHGADTDKPTWRLLLRNGLLIGLTGAALGASLQGASPRGLWSEQTWWWLGATAVTAGLVLILAMDLLPEPGAAPPVPVYVPVVPPADPHEYVRLPIPDAPVYAEGLGRRSLRTLVAQGPQLLVLAPPGAEEEAEREGLRAARLLPGVSVSVLARAAASAPTAVPRLVDETGVVALMLNVSGVEVSAVLLGADGWLAGGPVQGERAVIDFCDEIARTLSEDHADPGRGGRGLSRASVADGGSPKRAR